MHFTYCLFSLTRPLRLPLHQHYSYHPTHTPLNQDSCHPHTSKSALILTHPPSQSPSFQHLTTLLCSNLRTAVIVLNYCPAIRHTRLYSTILYCASVRPLYNSKMARVYFVKWSWNKNFVARSPVSGLPKASIFLTFLGLAEMRLLATKIQA